MLTEREAAKSLVARIDGLAGGRVMGFSAEDNAQLRAARIQHLERTLRALQRAQEVPQIVASEWDDAALAQAAERVGHQLERETAEHATARAMRPDPPLQRLGGDG